MDTSSTPSDRKRTRRWPLAAAAGLLAGGLVVFVVFVAFQVFTRASPDERATDLARRMVVTQDLSEIEATMVPRFEQETGCQLVSTCLSTVQRLTRSPDRRRGSCTDCARRAAAKAPPQAALALGKQPGKPRRRVRFARPSIGTRPLSRWWTAKHPTWTPGSDCSTHPLSRPLKSKSTSSKLQEARYPKEKL